MVMVTYYDIADELKEFLDDNISVSIKDDKAYYTYTKDGSSLLELDSEKDEIVQIDSNLVDPIILNNIILLFKTPKAKRSFDFRIMKEELDKVLRNGDSHSIYAVNRLFRQLYDEDSTNDHLRYAYNSILHNAPSKLVDILTDALRS